MLYTVKTDEKNFILSISHTDHDNIEIDDLSKLELKYLNAYQLVDGIPVINEMKKAELIAEENKQDHDAHIEELKQFLKDTDYITAETFEKVMSLNNPVTFITDILKILVEYKSKYAVLIEQRQSARAEIEDDKSE